MTDLLVTTHTPVLRSGQGVRTYGVARALAANGGLTLLYASFGAEQPDPAFRAIAGVDLHEALPSRGGRRVLAYAGARLRGVPAGFARGVSRELSAAAAALAAVPGRTRIVADGPIAAAALGGVARRRPVIYNAHNLESSFRHELDQGRRQWGSLGSFERALLASSAESWMVSEADMVAARELCPQATLRYVPNVVDTAAIVPVTPAKDARRALFVASFHYEPNRIGLRFLLDDVFPLVWSQLPEANLAIAGAGLEQRTFTDRRVRALGFVEDLRDVYADASCAVVPLLQGGGSPLKFVEALAFGLPVIATPRAAGGLHVRDGEHCLIADGPEAFAAALVGVLRDGAGQIAIQGRALVEREYSIDALSAILAPT